MLLDKIVNTFFWVILGTAFGYTWHCLSLATSYDYQQPAGWVCKNESIKTAMLKMGQRYPYKMVGETLYVDNGIGWRRLRY